MLRIVYKNNTYKKKIFRLAKGYRKGNSTLNIYIKEQLIQSYYFKYISRRLQKRKYRLSWISRLNIFCQLYNTNYSKVICNLHKNNIFINKKILAVLTFIDTSVFKKLIKI